MAVRDRGWDNSLDYDTAPRDDDPPDDYDNSTDNDDD